MEDGQLTYLLSYKFSQDHLEMFLWVIRACSGFNNNPTAWQFEAAYKRLMLHLELKPACNGTCLALDESNILTWCGIGVKSRQQDHTQINEFLLTPASNTMLDGNDYCNTCIRNHLSLYTEHIVEYLAGCAMKHISKSLS